MQNSFRFSSGSARVQQIKRVFAIDRCRAAVRIDILQLPMPPNIPPLLHVDVVSGSAKNDHAPDRSRARGTKRVIDILLQRHDPAAAIRAIGRDQRNRPTVDNPVANAVGAKSTEHY